MTHERFMQILEAYGADSRRWPECDRDAAEAYAMAHPELVADALALEQQLDAMLGPVDAAPSDMLQQRLLNQLPAGPARISWRAPVAAAAAMLLGVCIGFASGAFTAPEDEVDMLYADAFSGFEEDYVDWLESGA